MTREESNARRICCPMCDRKKCDREADDCDVKIYLKNKAESEGFVMDDLISRQAAIDAERRTDG